MNSVSLIGTLAAAPEFADAPDGVLTCRLRLAVSRHDRAGRAEPGVVYVDAIAVGAEARECAERLDPGDRVGVVGRLEREEWREESRWVVAYGVVIDQLDYL